MSRKHLLELGVDLFFSIFCIVIMVYSFLPQRAIVTVGDGIKSMTIPRIVISLMFFLIVLDLIRVLFQIRQDRIFVEKSENSLNPENVKKIVLTLATMIIYVVFWNIIGFTLSTILAIFIETKIVNKGIPAKKILLFGVCFTVLILITFGGLFAMDFPEPLLEMIRGY